MRYATKGTHFGELSSGALQADLTKIPNSLPTPARVFMDASCREVIDATAHASHELRALGIPIAIAYSMKTNPDRRILNSVRAAGLRVECVSQSEVSLALSSGWDQSEIVLNGPGKVLLSEEAQPVGVTFCDSLPELERSVRTWTKHGSARVAGVRIRAGSRSRFGVPVATITALHEACRVLDALPHETELAFHFHLASSEVGFAAWLRDAEQFAVAAEQIASTCGRRVRCLDFGGGFSAVNWPQTLRYDMTPFLRSITGRFPHLDELLLEPGKAIAEPSMALLTSVLEVRPKDCAVVVDGSIAELPDVALYRHPILVRRDGSSAWDWIADGEEKVYGRLCMENDVLQHGISLPPTLKRGDQMLFLRAGGYDASMAFPFGNGRAASPSQ